MGEFKLIDLLTQNTEIKHAATLKGIGDDAAVVDHSHLVSVISTDMLVEGVHFDMMYTPLQHLGFKAIAVNVSDICAMNATATQVLVSIAISNRFSVEALEALYEGIHHACQYFDVDLIGGDTTTSLKGLVISVTVIGEANESDIAYRNGAKPGDLICVTGDLGAAYCGLQLLEREKQIYLENPEIQPDLENKKHIVGRFLRPEARKDIITYFKQYLKKLSTIAIDMETATLFIVGLVNEIPRGALLLVSDIPMIPEGVKTEESDKVVTEKFADLHLEIGIEAMTELGVKGEQIKHYTY